MIQPIVNKTLLNILNDCNGNPLGETTLFNFVNMQLDAMAVSTAELRAHLTHCKDKGWVDYTVDNFDGADKWFITPRGKVARK